MPPQALIDKISEMAANDINELENVLGEVMRETRNIQINAQRSRDELRSTRQKVEESEARIRELEKELEETSDLVRHDQLTGVLNRRGIEAELDIVLRRGRRIGRSACALMLDCDDFKKEIGRASCRERVSSPV